MMAALKMPHPMTHIPDGLIAEPRRSKPHNGSQFLPPFPSLR